MHLFQSKIPEKILM